MGKKLYVGNLDFSIDSNALEKLFSEAGGVESARVITDRDSGRSKGFGFIEMTNDDDAAKAISQFDGYDFNGRNIRVSEARPQAPRSGGGGHRGDRGGRGGHGGHGRGRRD